MAETGVATILKDARTFHWTFAVHGKSGQQRCAHTSAAVCQHTLVPRCSGQLKRSRAVRCAQACAHLVARETKRRELARTGGAQEPAREQLQPTIHHPTPENERRKVRRWEGGSVQNAKPDMLLYATFGSHSFKMRSRGLQPRCKHPRFKRNMLNIVCKE
eukprot:6190361-Pleurochrysis_carterae.AAC.4